MNDFTKIEKYAIINILSHIMKADGVIHPKEEEYMDHIYKKFSISISDLDEIINLDDLQTKHIVCEMTGEKREQAMSMFVEMAKADGFVHPKETEILSRVFCTSKK